MGNKLTDLFRKMPMSGKGTIFGMYIPGTAEEKNFGNGVKENGTFLFC